MSVLSQMFYFYLYLPTADDAVTSNSLPCAVAQCVLLSVALSHAARRSSSTSWHFTLSAVDCDQTLFSANTPTPLRSGVIIAATARTPPPLLPSDAPHIHSSEKIVSSVVIRQIHPAVSVPPRAIAKNRVSANQSAGSERMAGGRRTDGEDLCAPLDEPRETRFARTTHGEAMPMAVSMAIAMAMAMM